MDKTIDLNSDELYLLTRLAWIKETAEELSKGYEDHNIDNIPKDKRTQDLEVILRMIKMLEKEQKEIDSKRDLVIKPDFLRLIESKFKQILNILYKVKKAIEKSLDIIVFINSI